MSILFTVNKLRLSLSSGARLGVPPLQPGLMPGLAPTFLRIFGVTKDSAGAALGSCTVHLFETLTDKYVEQTVSDANGNYEFRSASLSTTYFVVGYKAGGTAVAGTTVNTLVGS